VGEVLPALLFLFPSGDPPEVTAVRAKAAFGGTMAADVEGSG
jgi:hypothetical protein